MKHGILAFLAALLLAIPACERDDDRDVGERFEDAGEDIERGADDFGDDVERGVDDLGD